MVLKKFNVKHYRSIKDASIDFNKGVNILIGENNSGKTAVLDALRVCLSYGKQWRDIWVSVNDFHLDKNNPDAKIEDIEFHLFFEIENAVETGIYNDLLSVGDGGKQELQLHFRYYIDERSAVKKVRYKVWGGDNEGESITPDVLDLIYFIHLDALRDAVRHLRPVRGNRLGELYSKIVTDEKHQEFLSGKVRNVLNRDTDWDTLIDQGKSKVNEHLKETTITGKEQNVEIDFLPFEFRRIVDNLRIQTPVYNDDVIENGDKQRYFELYQNGMEYNNLIYIATVLGDLKRQKELESNAYVALLVEEPEAHLHPQLQSIFFNYLNKLNEIGFQIVVSSHSPTISAKADLDSLIVLQEQENKIMSLAIKKSNLDDTNKKYLKKFLDVTKCQLFFSNGVILVEGISEALLIPVFSEIIGSDYSIEKKGIELVNLNGVAFEHFGKLFNSDDPKMRLNCRCAILTDDDRTGGGGISSRAAKAQELESGQLRVVLAEKTFEIELFKSGNNKDILLEIFGEMHPTAAGRIEEGASIDEHANSFLEKINSNKAKSELAHCLAIRLESDAGLRNEFTVPDYIRSAIKWVVKGE
ncbi:MAG: ATP-dependent nuclease [Syntrophobacteraceae bacterium]